MVMILAVHPLVVKIEVMIVDATGKSRLPVAVEVAEEGVVEEEVVMAVMIGIVEETGEETATEGAHMMMTTVAAEVVEAPDAESSTMGLIAEVVEAVIAALAPQALQGMVVRPLPMHNSLLLHRLWMNVLNRQRKYNSY